jgi:hypothetical protein
MIRQFPTNSIALVFLALVPCMAARAQNAAPDAFSLKPLYVPGQLAAISREGAASDALPVNRLREFSTHSHMTYQMMPRVVEVPRLSPEAHAPMTFVPLH